MRSLVRLLVPAGFLFLVAVMSLTARWIAGEHVPAWVVKSVWGNFVLAAACVGASVFVVVFGTRIGVRPLPPHVATDVDQDEAVNVIRSQSPSSVQPIGVVVAEADGSVFDVSRLRADPKTRQNSASLREKLKPRSRGTR